MCNGSLSYWPGSIRQLVGHFRRPFPASGRPALRSTERARSQLGCLQAPGAPARNRDLQHHQTGGLIRPYLARIAYSLYVLAWPAIDAVGLNYYRARPWPVTAPARRRLRRRPARLPEHRAAASGPRPASRAGSWPALHLPPSATWPDSERLLAADPPIRRSIPLGRQLSQVKTRPRLAQHQRHLRLPQPWSQLATRNVGSTVTAQLLADNKTISAFSGKDLTVSNVVTASWPCVPAAGRPLRYRAGGHFVAAGCGKKMPPPGPPPVPRPHRHAGRARNLPPGTIWWWMRRSPFSR
jgi:hypothetical protein